MVIDLCLREVKTAMGSKLETTAALFLLCVCGGRGSIRKEVVGGRCAMKGRQWRVICYISLMSRWPNGSRKSVSFSWGNQSSRSHSPDQIFIFLKMDSQLLLLGFYLIFIIPGSVHPIQLTRAL